MINSILERKHYAGAMYRATSDISPIQSLCSSLTHIQISDYSPGPWRIMEYNSARPLLNEPEIGREFYTYPFLIRESQDRFILLSHDEVLVSEIINKPVLANLLQRPKINIADLVRDIVSPLGQNGRKYLMSGAWAAVDGQGKRLKTLSFFGDDLAESELFCSLLKMETPCVVSPYRVVLRDIKTKAEIVSVGSNGELSIYLRGTQHLAALDELMKFLTRSGYVTW